MKSGKDSFAVKEWLAADADARSATAASLEDGVSCDASGCVTPMAGGAFAALSLRPDALSDDCARAALVFTARKAPEGCAAAVIDAERLRRQGALALRFREGGFVVDAVKPRGVSRPWSQGDSTEEGDTNLIVPRRAPNAVDATPSESDLQADD